MFPLDSIAPNVLEIIIPPVYENILFLSYEKF
jgi:hypothetical protein